MARDILAELEQAKDKFVEYRSIYRQISQARGQVTEELLELEDQRRQELTQMVGRVLPVLRRLDVPLEWSIPALGRRYGVFEVALDARLEHLNKGQCIDMALQSPNQAIGAVSGYDDDQRAALATPRKAAPTDVAQPTTDAEQQRSLDDLAERLKRLEDAAHRRDQVLRWFVVVAIWTGVLAGDMLYLAKRWPAQAKGADTFLVAVVCAMSIAIPLGWGRATKALMAIFAALGALLGCLQYCAR